MEPLFKPPVLLIVAHWDDEIFSAGGTLVKYGKGWTVVSATWKPHPNVRSHGEIFDRVCRDIGAIPATLPICQRTRNNNIDYDTPKTELLNPLIHNKLRKKFGRHLEEFNTIITHNQDGDLGGHVQHVQLNTSVREIFKDKDIYTFVQAPALIRKISEDAINDYCKEKATHFVELTDDEYKKKIEFVKMYKPYYPRFAASNALNKIEWFKK